MCHYIKHIIYSFSDGKPWIPYIGRYSSYYQRFSIKEYEEQKKIYFLKIDKFYEDNYNKIQNLYHNYSKEFISIVKKNKW